MTVEQLEKELEMIYRFDLGRVGIRLWIPHKNGLHKVG